jgi:type II secretory pathway pseudopilin PulG
MRRRRVGRGSSLISAVVAMAMVATCLVMVVRTYVTSRRYVAVQTQRMEAFAQCQQQIERLRAGGYRALPAEGEHAFGSDGQLVIAPGPVADSRLVTARAVWPATGAPPGRMELTTVICARGCSP